jgi:transcription initiation factor IIF auxiliary subunit
MSLNNITKIGTLAITATVVGVVCYKFYHRIKEEMVHEQSHPQDIETLCAQAVVKSRAKMAEAELEYYKSIAAAKQQAYLHKDAHERAMQRVRSHAAKNKEYNKQHAILIDKFIDDEIDYTELVKRLNRLKD